MPGKYPLIPDEKPMGQLKQLVAELHELEVETFEVEDTFDLGQNAPAALKQAACTSCCSCTSSCCSTLSTSCSTAAMPAHERQ